MKVVIAIDSFKGSLSSMEAGQAARKGVLRVFPKAQIVVKPLADGGEGTMETLCEGLGGKMEEIEVKGPLGDPVKARYGLVKDTAIMEMAQASGITLIEADKLDPFRASTFGTGQMIKAALDKGIRKFIMGIGGSATTEGGIGMLAALGARFLDGSGKQLAPDFTALKNVETIDLSGMDERLKESEFLVACDVSNPLVGKQGAIAVYGPQKGVKQADIGWMDKAMEHYASITQKSTGKKVKDLPGAGAAGGLGFALMNFLDARLQPGIELVLDYLGYDKVLEGCDVLITGEGRIDGQTAMGKVPVGVAKLAKEISGCKTMAFAGSISKGAELCNQEGIDAFFPVVRGVTTLGQAMDKKNAARNLTESVEQVFRVLK